MIVIYYVINSEVMRLNTISILLQPVCSWNRHVADMRPANSMTTISTYKAVVMILSHTADFRQPARDSVAGNRLTFRDRLHGSHKHTQAFLSKTIIIQFSPCRANSFAVVKIDTMTAAAGYSALRSPSWKVLLIHNCAYELNVPTFKCMHAIRGLGGERGAQLRTGDQSSETQTIDIFSMFDPVFDLHRSIVLTA